MTVVYNKSKPETIQEMFSSIAKQYDRGNAVLSFGLHRYWNRKLVDIVTREGTQETFLDLCCGTGDIAFDYLKRFQEPKRVYMLDFCQAMLDQAKHKEKQLPCLSHSIEYITADAQAIPLEDSSISMATMAYGIRNVRNPSVCLSDVYRVLKPGGVFGVLELTQPNNFFLKAGHKVYLSTVLPLLGRIVASNQSAYQYLCNSIQEFIKPSQLEGLFQEAGFTQTRQISLLGGIATILIGKK